MPNICAPSHAPALPADLLHGLVLRPPVLAWDGLNYLGSQLSSVELTEVSRLTGVVSAVQRQHFLGLVAVAPLYAQQALDRLQPVWTSPTAPKAQPLTGASYTWNLPHQPPAAQAQVAVWCLADRAHVWLPESRADILAWVHTELQQLLQISASQLQISPWPQASHPSLPALALLDAAADAALLSQALQRPVCLPCSSAGHDGRLQLAPAPSSAPGMQLAPPPSASQAAAAEPGPWQSSSVWQVRPSLARLLSQPNQARPSAQPSLRQAGRVQPAYQAHALVHADIQALNAAQVFASESQLHDQAVALGQDPLSWRIEQLTQGPGRRLAEQVLQRAEPLASAAAEDGRLHGRGLASAEVLTRDEQGAEQRIWSTWVAEVAVDPQSGAIEVTRVVAGQDSQQLQAAHSAAIVQQDGRLLTHAQQWLGSTQDFDSWVSPAAGVPSSAIAPSPSQLPAAEPLRHGQLAADGVLSLPAAAAIANAVQQATGVRLREVPLQPQTLQLALASQPGTTPTTSALRKSWGWLAAGAAGAAGLAAMAWPLKPALPLIDGPDISVYSAQALERGRLVAAAGDCVVCHTAPGGASNAGGLGLETPFGTIYTTNITPDKEHGIGRWSYAAFERAMRQGIHQDGRQLYPAFPYTSFAKLSDGDMQALYGYLMSQPAVAAQAPKTELAFPYSLRPAMAGWNALFHDAQPFKADPNKSPEWNRGAYLVEGAGHCSACHSPRNALGAEKAGLSHLAGGEAEGWTAPALNQLAGGKQPWSADELYQYLRSGFSARHGVAAGPMAPVIHGLAELPDSDLRAMSSYLLDLPGSPAASAQPKIQPAAALAAAPAALTPAPELDALVSGARIYSNACAVCHEADSGPTLFGVKPNLGLNTNLHAATPDNLIQVVLHGVQQPAQAALGYMPGFKDSLNDQQIHDLLAYLRQRFAPEEPAWSDSRNAVQRLRLSSHANQQEGGHP